MQIFAIIEDDIVVNTIEWDGDSTWYPPSGTELVEVDTEVTLVGVGFLYVDGEFTAPEIEPEAD